MQKTIKLLKRILLKRMLLGSDLSNTRTIKNGVPQGLVLAPTFFNLYISDLPDTISRKFTYAEDLSVTYQARDTKKIEEVLGSNCQTIYNYFNKWYLELNTTKTVTNLFYLNNHEADKTINIKINDSQLPNDKIPKNLGVYFDRTLTYRKHLEESANKLKKRNSLIRKLSETTWSASPSVPKISALALCYSVVEPKISIQLCQVMRIISNLAL